VLTVDNEPGMTKKAYTGFDYLRITGSEEASLYYFEHGIKNYESLLHTSPSETVCLSAVNRDGTALQYINQGDQSNTVCKAALEQNGCALIHVRNQTENLCRQAVSNDTDALACISDSHMADKIASEFNIQYGAPSM